MHIEQVGVSMEDISFLAWTRWSLAGGLLVISWCAGLESRATHSSDVALEASVLSVPHFLLALEFPLEQFQQQLKFWYVLLFTIQFSGHCSFLLGCG